VSTPAPHPPRARPGRPADPNSDIGRRRMERRQAIGRRSDVRWSEILAGSAAAFARHGYAQATIEDIAEEVGLSRATLYYYVGTKEELLVALLDDPIDTLRMRLEEVADRPLPARDKLVAALREYLRTMAELPALFIFLSENVHRVMAGPEADHIRANADRYGRVLAQIIADGAANGEFRSDIDAQTAVLGIIGMFNWMHRWFDPGGRKSLADFGEDFISLALSALAPAPR
jgi:TetR/AcrR family transcriptional regulator, cholesterol catabolism regulator